MKKIVGIAISLMMFFGALNVFAASNVSPSEIVERNKMIKDQLSAGDEIVKKTKNKDAEAIMKFLHESSYLRIPVHNNAGLATLVAENSPKKDYYLGMVPLMAKDEKINEKWKEESKVNQVASYFGGDNPMIVLKKGDLFSNFWKGVVLIHEGHHALADAVEIFSSIKDPGIRRTVGEVYAYSLEIELLEKIGGTEYKKLVQEEIGRLEDNYLKNKQIKLPDYKRYEARIEKIFGKSNSNIEKGSRGSLLWINSIFRLIDKIYFKEDEREKRKVDFLFTAYSNGNIQ